MSSRFSLSKTDFKKIAKGALVAAGGAVLTYLATIVVPELQNSDNSVVLTIASVLMILINAAQKLLSGPK